MMIPRPLLLLFSVGAMVACSAAEVSNADNEQVGDEDFTAAEATSEPLRAELILALKKVNRADLLPSKVAFVYRPGVIDAVEMDVDYNGTYPEDESEFGYARSILKTRGLRIVGKKVAFEDCEFAGTKDYLGLLAAPTFLSGPMIAVNTAFGPEEVYSAAAIANAKAVEATASYKLTLTKEHMAVYLGKISGKWKIVAIDVAEFSCSA